MKDEHRPIAYDFHGAAATLGISYGKLIKMADAGQIPFIIIGKRRFFRSEVIDNMLAPKVTADQTESLFPESDA